MKNEELYYKSRRVRLAVPSKGRMEKETQDFLKECGFNIQRNTRQYIGYINSPIDLQLVYQRQVDIVRGVLNGSLELGIVGYDLVLEYLPDGNKDLVTGGNFYGTDAEFGRYDASIGDVIINKGQNNLEVVTAYESGFQIPGHVCQISKINIGGKDHLLIARNNDKFSLFKVND